MSAPVTFLCFKIGLPTQKECLFSFFPFSCVAPSVFWSWENCLYSSFLPVCGPSVSAFILDKLSGSVPTALLDDRSAYFVYPGLQTKRRTVPAIFLCNLIAEVFGDVSNDPEASCLL